MKALFTVVEVVKGFPFIEKFRPSSRSLVSHLHSSIMRCGRISANNPLLSSFFYLSYKKSSPYNYGVMVSLLQWSAITDRSNGRWGESKAPIDTNRPDFSLIFIAHSSHSQRINSGWTQTVKKDAFSQASKNIAEGEI